MSNKTINYNPYADRGALPMPIVLPPLRRKVAS